MLYTLTHIQAHTNTRCADKFYEFDKEFLSDQWVCMLCSRISESRLSFPVCAASHRLTVRTKGIVGDKCASFIALGCNLSPQSPTGITRQGYIAWGQA